MSSPSTAEVSSPAVVVLGSANMDLVIRQTRAARPGETVFGKSFGSGAGGKGLNQAVAAARAGASVGLLAAVGDDDFGVRLRTFLAEQDVDTRGVSVVTEATGVASITVTDDGENSIVVVAGANAASELSEEDRAAIARATYLVVQLERPIRLVEEALKVARAHGVATVLTPAPVVEGVRDLIELCDILIANEIEAVSLAATDDPHVAAQILSREAGRVVVTLGARGALLAQDGVIAREIRAVAVDVVDTTGAGDTFAGVLVAMLAEGRDFGDAMDAATRAGALAVTREGAAASMPLRAEFDGAPAPIQTDR
ncbi:ribokinase [Microbacterium chocolatum]|uniref:ribokinase n=1 Tax=Microbacterium aurantiacum TaxID=162393 RepID=UPI00339008C8